MSRRILLLAVLPLTACATVGPPRPTLAQALAGEEAPPDDEVRQQKARLESAAPVREEAPVAPASEDLPKASPFSAGLLLGAGLFLDGTARVLPAQLAVGSLKVLGVGPRAINLLALGGISGTSISQARAAWGAGAALELTPGTLPYEVDAALGLLWVKGEDRPAALLGFTLTPKM